LFVGIHIDRRNHHERAETRRMRQQLPGVPGVVGDRIHDGIRPARHNAGKHRVVAIAQRRPYSGEVVR
jgi:hypothetical protein